MVCRHLLSVFFFLLSENGCYMETRSFVLICCLVFWLRSSSLLLRRVLFFTSLQLVDSDGRLLFLRSLTSCPLFSLS